MDAKTEIQDTSTFIGGEWVGAEGGTTFILNPLDDGLYVRAAMDTIHDEARMPFGGNRESGIGRERMGARYGSTDRTKMDHHSVVTTSMTIISREERTMTLKRTIVAALTACILAGSAHAETKFSLSYFMGPKHRFNAAFFTPFAEKLEKLSGGKLTVKQYPGGTLNSNPALQYSTVIDGVTDIAFGISSYTYDLFPISSAISVPGVCNSGIDCTEALWRAKDLIEGEFNAKVIAMWSNEPMAIVTRNKAVRTLEDFKGLKIRVSSNIEADFLGALGAAPVSQSVTEINQNLANGTIDAIAIDPTSVRDFKLYEPGKYITLGMPTSGLAFWLLMNKKKYDSLSSEEKAWVAEASGRELSVKGAMATEAMADAALQVARKAGVEIITLSPEEVARITKAFEPALAKFKAKTFKGVSGADIFAAMKGK